MTQNSGKTYEVLDHRMPDLQRQIDKINRRAAKLGCPVIDLRIGEPYDVKVGQRSHATGREATVIIRKRTVEVIGEAPCVSGWALVAKLMHVDGMVIVAAVAGEPVPIEFREVEPGRCDHCHTRRQRTDTFLLRSEQGEYCVVGRNCLADFLGGHDPRRAVAACQYFLDVQGLLEEEENERWGEGSGHWRLSPIAVLARTAVAIREFGWLSRTKARESGEIVEATADAVEFGIFAKDSEVIRWWDERITAKDYEAAEAAWQWAQTAGEGTDSDYLYNVRAVASMTSIPTKLLGIACSILPSHRRDVEREIERRRVREESKHFGTPKKREVFTLTVVGCRVIEGYYGAVGVYRFVEGGGNQATWFASSDPDLEIGETYQIKATVKKHDEYKGVAQTVLTRCNVLK